MTRIAFFGTLLAMFIVAGCYYDNGEELYQFYYEANPCDTTITTFADVVFPIIQANCATTGCHVAGGSGPGLYENYDQVKGSVDDGKLENRVLIQKDMPPSGPLTDCQMALIQRWLNNGAQNN
jgi:hypothetical protein